MAGGATRRGALLAALGVLLLPQLARAQTCPSGFITWCAHLPIGVLRFRRMRSLRARVAVQHVVRERRPGERGRAVVRR